MKKLIWILGIAALAMLVVVPAWTQSRPQREAGVGGTLAPPPPNAVVLYDQTDSASGNGAPDQDFETAFDIYDSEGADDFIVTSPAGWSVTGVNTVGTNAAVPSSTVRVNFHADSAGTPGAVQCSYGGLVQGVNYVDSGGSLTITLPAPCVLSQATWWVAIQVQQDFGTAGQHFWSNRTVTTGNGAVWRNPLNGFGTGCTDWAPMSQCGVGGGFPDFLFQVMGDVVPVELESFEIEK